MATSSAGRRTARYKAARQALLGLPCHECGAPATVADHHPPLSTFAHPDLWTGVLLPHCRTCSNRQGAMIRNRIGTPSRP
jgi:hypothetical protein